MQCCANVVPLFKDPAQGTTNTSTFDEGEGGGVGIVLLSELFPFEDSFGSTILSPIADLRSAS